MRRLRFLILALLLFSFYAAATEHPLTVIHLQYQPATAVLPVLKAAMGRSETITGSQQILLLRASADTVAKVRHLVKTLDKRLETLIISVWFTDQRQTLQQRRSLLRLRAYQTQRNDAGNDIRQVRVLDGHSAFIRSGQIRRQLSAVFADQRGVGAEFDDQVRSSGFYVKPRLLGREVLLAISAQKEALDRFGQQHINTQGVVTTLRVPLGEWVALGGITDEIAQRGTHNVFQSNDRDQRQVIYLRVEK